MIFKRQHPQIDPSTRDEILTVAQKVFAETGFKEATVRQICKAAKANVCLISYYFGGKEGLYRAVFEKVGNERVFLAQKWLQEVPSIESAEEYKGRLAIFLEQMSHEIMSKPDFLRLMQREITEGMPRAKDIISHYINGARKTFEEFLNYGIKKKFVRKDLDPTLGSLAIINMCLGFANQFHTQFEFFFPHHPKKDLPKQISGTVSSIFISGVLQ